MSQVVEGEVVETAPSPSRSKLTARYTGIKIQKRIIEEMDARMKEEDYAFTLSTLARKNGIAPVAFVSALHDGLESPDHALHDFAVEVQRRWAECEEKIFGKMLATAEAKGKWEGLATALERTRRDEWVKPSERAREPASVNVAFVDKMQLIQGRNELTTGD
jgi:hypothetical protein